MKKIFLLFILFLNFNFYVSFASEGTDSLRKELKKYCIEFSKGEKKTYIKQNKQISFWIKNDSVVKHGLLKIITRDSLTVEIGGKNKTDLHTYSASDFKMLAFKSASSTAKGVTFTVPYGTIYTVVVAFANTQSPDFKIPARFFEKTINLDEGWIAKIVECK